MIILTLNIANRLDFMLASLYITSECPCNARGGHENMFLNVKYEYEIQIENKKLLKCNLYFKFKISKYNFM